MVASGVVGSGRWADICREGHRLLVDLVAGHLVTGLDLALFYFVERLEIRSKLSPDFAHASLLCNEHQTSCQAFRSG